MTSSYKILFAVDILHDYYKSGLCTDFNIIPSSETDLVLKKYHLVYKNIGNRLVILTKVKKSNDPLENGKIIAPIDTDTKFVFYLSLTKAEFTTYSNLNLDKLQNNRLYFTNLNKNTHLTFSHISAEIAGYDDTKQYLPGDFADDGTKKIFECIKSTAGNNTAKTAFWTSRNEVQYVSSGDFIQTGNSVLNYKSALPSANFVITIFDLDKTTNGYSRVLSSEKQTFTEPTKNLQLDLAKLKVRPGKYKIRINAEEFFIYVADEFIYGGYFGVMEIFSHLPKGDPFHFIDAGDKPTEKQFYIRFANRQATWKYITPRHSVTSIIHPSNKYIFNPSPVLPAAADYFESNIPVPMTQFPEEFRLQLSPQVSSGPPRAPGPDITLPGVLTKTLPGNDFFCNIYLNF